jgi:uncharacterized protein DUF6232
MRIRTYYRGPDAVVTSELFVWHTTPAKTFAIRELKSVVIVRGGVSRNRAYGAQIAGSVAVAAAVWPILDNPTLVVAVFLGVAAIPGVAVAAFVRRPRWELRASYRNVAVVLYESRDQRVFNQVSRALRRAMEDAGPNLRSGAAA